MREFLNAFLVGGFNPFEKIIVKMGSSSPSFGVKIKNIWVATTQTIDDIITRPIDDIMAYYDPYITG